ncbi:MAG: DUF1816 domain-containing protein [Oscillatoriales cyanobacterium]|jgi:Domain of unknown function (DUF1816)|nr:MAG: DUF1816 domain-containing protein [Oscillatoriales cyanobacterium]
MKELFINIKQALGRAWWVKVSTKTPACVYYFGPFGSEAEATTAQTGYVEDLKQEGAQDIAVTILRCKQPDNLTVFDEASDSVNPNQPVVLSGQT